MSGWLGVLGARLSCPEPGRRRAAAHAGVGTRRRPGRALAPGALRALCPRPRGPPARGPGLLGPLGQERASDPRGAGRGPRAGPARPRLHPAGGRSWRPPGSAAGWRPRDPLLAPQTPGALVPTDQSLDGQPAAVRGGRGRRHLLLHGQDCGPGPAAGERPAPATGSRLVDFGGDRERSLEVGGTGTAESSLPALSRPRTPAGQGLQAAERWREQPGRSGPCRCVRDPAAPAGSPGRLAEAGPRPCHRCLGLSRAGHGLQAHVP